MHCTVGVHMAQSCTVLRTPTASDCGHRPHQSDALHRWRTHLVLRTPTAIDCGMRSAPKRTTEKIKQSAPLDIKRPLLNTQHLTCPLHVYFGKIKRYIFKCVNNSKGKMTFEPVTKQHTDAWWIAQSSAGYVWTTTKPTVTKEQQAFLIRMSDWLNHTEPRHQHTWFANASLGRRLWMGQYLGQAARDWLMQEEFGHNRDQKAYDEMMQDMRQFRTKRKMQYYWAVFSKQTQICSPQNTQ